MAQNEMKTVEVDTRAGREISDWRPDDPAFWNSGGSKVAYRNLWISIPCLMLAFIVWMLWSVVAVKLNDIGFAFNKSQLFLLASIPPLVGATLRIFYSFLVPIFGGRRWTAISTASLVIPAVWMGYAVQDPATPFATFIAIAAFCGFGGGNFSSSMANISFFFPKSRKGLATGLNAGLGNLGVSVVQFVAPIAIGLSLFGSFGGGAQSSAPATAAKPAAVAAPLLAPPPVAPVEPGIASARATDDSRESAKARSKSVWLQNASFLWIPFILLFSVMAWFGMNDLASAKASFREQAVIFGRKHNWIMCWLYLGTFGSFIGFSSGFGILIKSQFPDVDAVKFAFLGPLVGALLRPLGGWVSDKIGGARVTLAAFLAMILGVLGVLHYLPQEGSAGSFPGFLACFLALFALAGIGNGSTFRMIPIIFLTRGRGQDAVASRESAAVLGFSGAIGAYGGFFIPKSFGSSIAATGHADAALWGFIAFYVSCVAVTWWYYARAKAEVPC